MAGCTAWIDKLLLSYNENMDEAKNIKGIKQIKKRMKLTALYRGQLLSLIDDFQNNKF